MTDAEVYWSSMSDDALEKAMQDPAVLQPVWQEGGRVHNWRNHVGENAKKLWLSFSAEQKAALAVDADVSAMNEEWE